MKNGTLYRVQLCHETACHAQGNLRQQIENGIAHLSCQSRWQRFATPISHLTEKQLDVLTDLDNKDRVAWCASIQGDEGERGIALGRYIKLDDEEGVAEFALTVLDEFQNQGVGRMLLTKLIESANANGFTKLRGHVTKGNTAMLALSQRFNAERHVEAGSSIVVEIPVSGEI